MVELIPGKIVTLRPANIEDRRSIFEWLTNSDITKFMMGPPIYPDSNIPTWEEFIDDYQPFFFDSSQPLMDRCFVIEVNSEPIGQINHDKIYPKDNSTELDIWLKSSAYTGKGYGSDAIITLCNYLNEKYKCKKFIIAPSRRNPRAIGAYKKAGFSETNEVPENFIPDYSDIVIMIKTVK
jgi:RimJ/RimL family protein N-acetyltransferase